MDLMTRRRVMMASTSGGINPKNYNLLNGLDYVNGYITANGTIQTSHNEQTFEYIDMDGVTHILLLTIRYPDARAWWVVVGCYDGNKNFLERITVIAESSANRGVAAATGVIVPENARYIRLSMSSYGNALVSLAPFDDAVSALGARQVP